MQQRIQPSVSITPQASAPLFGRGGRAAAFSRVADELEANIIALPGTLGLVLIVALDTLFAGDAFEAAVRQQLSLQAQARLQHIIFIASHTHNAPALDPSKPLLGRMDAEYFAATAAIVAISVAEALRRECAPAQIEQGRASCHLNASRRKRGLRLQARPPFVTMAINLLPVHGANVPRGLDLILARDADGQPLWAIWHWCCHASAAPDAASSSADFPAYVRTILRQRLGNPALPVVFLPGFCGDIRPDPAILPIDPKYLAAYPFQRPFARPTQRSFTLLCKRLGHAIDAALADCTARGPLSPVRMAQAAVPLAAIIQDGDAGNLGVTAMDAGPFGLLLAGAEVCSPYIQKCAPIVPKNWLLSGYAGQVFGYLPTDSQIADGGYEAEGFFTPFGLAGRFKPQVEDRFMAAVQQAVDGTRANG